MRFRFDVPRGIAVAVLLVVVALAVLVLPATAQGPPTEGLKLNVFANTRGPLSACDQAGSCTPDTVVQHFLYVDNTNPVEHLSGGGVNRAGVTNAFVVSSVEETIYVNGVQKFDSVNTPPPDANYQPWSGHWPVSAACPGSGPPCNVVGPPAVLPGERTAVLYGGWAHGSDEPDGTYVFKFTVHGAVNGAPVDLVGTSPKIVMTR